jgi:acetoin utilization deacetylase AcuC-like enzyme
MVQELALAHDLSYVNSQRLLLDGAAAPQSAVAPQSAQAPAAAAPSTKVQDPADPPQPPATAAPALSAAQASAIAAGAVVDVATMVARGKATNGLALVRPCGSHVSRRGDGQCDGDGVFNAMAVAARAVQKRGAARRVLVFDWAVAPGRGVQEITYDDATILSFSIHSEEVRERAWIQCDHPTCQKWRLLPIGVSASDVGAGQWFCDMNPDTKHNWCGAPEQVKAPDNAEEDGGITSDAENVGRGKGQGRTVNLAWPKGGMGDGDYIHAVSRLLLPIAYDFRPDLILVGSRFDAAEGAHTTADTRMQHKLNGEGFAHLLALLQPVAPGRTVLVCEGGNNIRATADALGRCVSVLRGEHPPRMRTGLRPRHACGERAVATFCATVLAGIYLSNVCPCRNIEAQRRGSVVAVSRTAEAVEPWWKGVDHETPADSDGDADNDATLAAPKGQPPPAKPPENTKRQEDAAPGRQPGAPSKRGSEAGAPACEPPAGTKKRKVVAADAKAPPLGAVVQLADGRQGVLRGTGHGYLQIELPAATSGGGQGGQVVNVRSSEMVAQSSSGRARPEEQLGETGAGPAEARKVVTLLDGRRGSVVRSGHGYVRVALDDGSEISTRVADLVRKAATLGTFWHPCAITSFPLSLSSACADVCLSLVRSPLSIDAKRRSEQRQLLGRSA